MITLGGSQQSLRFRPAKTKVVGESRNIDGVIVAARD